MIATNSVYLLFHVTVSKFLSGFTENEKLPCVSAQKPLRRSHLGDLVRAYIRYVNFECDPDFPMSCPMCCRRAGESLRHLLFSTDTVL